MQALQFVGGFLISSIRSLSASSISSTVCLSDTSLAFSRPKTLSRLALLRLKRASALSHDSSSYFINKALEKTTTTLLVVVYFFSKHSAVAIDMRVLPLAAGTTII